MKIPLKAIAGMSAVAVVAAALLMNPARAIGVSTDNLKLVTGQSSQVTASGITGRATSKVSTGAPFSAVFKQSGTAATLTIKGSKAGSGTVTLTDTSSVRVVNVQVVAPMTATPAKLTINVGDTNQISLNSVFDTAALTVTASSGAVSILAVNTSANPVIVEISGASASSGVTITAKDGKTTVKSTVIVKAVTTAGITGRLLASNCYQCHGTNAGGGFERLSKMSTTEIVSELKEMRTKAQTNDIMTAHALGYTDAQIQALAAYIDTLG